MNSLSSTPARIVSGMRPTGFLHIGHYHGVLKNWIRLQQETECLFFVADWHALTTHYENPGDIAERSLSMVVEWLACGVNPRLARVFIQSHVPEHAELHLLLSMIAPLGWLERVPSYRDQQEKLADRDLATYGFLGYPLLQSADILIYKADGVPVGEDQVAHIELTREIARRFNHLFGREPDFELRAEQAIRMLGKKQAQLYRSLRKRYQEQGEQEALNVARALLEDRHILTMTDRERLMGYLEGSGRNILTEPQALLTPESRMPGLDGQKMSKSYGNTIDLRDPPETITRKIRTMPTDPARVRRIDPGEPEKCPVWGLHKVYSNQDVQEWVQGGCRSAGIGCLDCKQPLIDALNAELDPIQFRIKEYESDFEMVQAVINEGTETARELARSTLHEVRQTMGLSYR